MKKNIIIFFLLIFVFMYGVIVGAKKIFPYYQIKYVKSLILGNPIGSCHKENIYDILLEDNESKLIKY